MEENFVRGRHDGVERRSTENADFSFEPGNLSTKKKAESLIKYQMEYGIWRWLTNFNPLRLSSDSFQLEIILDRNGPKNSNLTL